LTLYEIWTYDTRKIHTEHINSRLFESWQNKKERRCWFSHSPREEVMLMCTINSIISIRFKKNKIIMQYTQITYLSCQSPPGTWPKAHMTVTDTHRQPMWFISVWSQSSFFLYVPNQEGQLGNYLGVGADLFLPFLTPLPGCLPWVNYKYAYSIDTSIDHFHVARAGLDGH